MVYAKPEEKTPFELQRGRLPVVMYGPTTARCVPFSVEAGDHSTRHTEWGGHAGDGCKGDPDERTRPGSLQRQERSIGTSTGAN